MLHVFVRRARAATDEWSGVVVRLIIIGVGTTLVAGIIQLLFARFTGASY